MSGSMKERTAALLARTKENAPAATEAVIEQQRDDSLDAAQKIGKKDPAVDLTEARRLFDLGFKMCKLKPNSKQPEGDGWNQKPINQFDSSATGYGVLLASNGLCSIDPDNADKSAEMLKGFGFDLDALLDAGVRSISTRPQSGGRAVFKAPADVRKVLFAFKECGVVLELRAFSPNLQDVVPGLVYQDKNGELRTQTYASARRLDDAPELPADFLNWWRRMSTDFDFLRAQKQKAGEILRLAPNLSVSSADGKTLAFKSSMRGSYNEANEVPEILIRHGYTSDSDHQRFAPPTATGLPGVRPIPGRDGLWQSDHASDPLSGTFDAWAAFVVLDHKGNLGAAEDEWRAHINQQVADDFDHEESIDDLLGLDVAAKDKPAIASLDIGSLFKDLALTLEDVSKMADAEFLIDNLVVRGSLSVFVAPANGGKTTLFIHLCEELAAKGMKIFYINADASPSDLKRHYNHASQHNYVVLAPDAKVGKGPRDIIAKLNQLNIAGAELSDVVIVLDTLKKFASVIEKKNMRDFLALMRGISTKGATIIMLAHTNKYVGDDGKHIFEGTGDLRNDVDHLIYLEGGKDETTRRQEITTRPDKVRANFKPVSYWIDLDTRKVQRADQVLPVISDDERAIAAQATEAISKGNSVQKTITDYVKSALPEIGDKKIRNTLHKLAHGEARIFDQEQGPNNSHLYKLRSKSTNDFPDMDTSDAPALV